MFSLNDLLKLYPAFFCSPSYRIQLLQRPLRQFFLVVCCIDFEELECAPHLGQSHRIGMLLQMQQTFQAPFLSRSNIL